MTKLAIGTFLSLLLCFAMMEPALAQSPLTMGVSKGDVFVYDFQAYYSSGANPTPPAQLLELNQTNWVRITITNVSDTQIWSQVTTNYKNGTELNADGFCDIDTGDSYGMPPIISANLSSNDQVNPSNPEPWFINDTTTLYYENSERETNHLIFYTNSTSETGQIVILREYFFDKKTGVLAQYSTDVSTNDYVSSTRSKLTSSSVWVIPEFPSFIIMPAFMIITLLVIAVKKRLFHRPP